MQEMTVKFSYSPRVPRVWWGLVLSLVIHPDYEYADQMSEDNKRKICSALTCSHGEIKKAVSEATDELYGVLSNILTIRFPCYDKHWPGEDPEYSATDTQVEVYKTFRV